MSVSMSFSTVSEPTKQHDKKIKYEMTPVTLEVEFAGHLDTSLYILTPTVKVCEPLNTEIDR